MSSANAVKAKQFVVNRILDQAKLDDMPLSAVEIKMLGFAEASASRKDMEAAAVLERDYDDEEYEAKVADLLRRAYKRDKEGGEETAWDSALPNLVEEDMNLLVMLKRAGIEGSNPYSYLLDWRMLLGLMSFCIPASVGIIIAFTSIGARLIPNEILRLVLLMLLLVGPLLISKIGRKEKE